MIEETSKAGSTADVVCTVLEGGEAVLLHLQTQACFTLNETGHMIWRLLGEGLCVGEVADRIEADYDVTRDEALRGVLELAGELESSGLASFGSDE